MREGAGGQCEGRRWSGQAPQHFLNFLPLPQGHGSFRPAFCLVTGFVGASLNMPDRFDISLRGSPAPPKFTCVFWRGTLPAELTVRETSTVAARRSDWRRNSFASSSRPCSSHSTHDQDEDDTEFRNNAMTCGASRSGTSDCCWIAFREWAGRQAGPPTKCYHCSIPADRAYSKLTQITPNF